MRGEGRGREGVEGRGGEGGGEGSLSGGENRGKV